MNLLPPPCYPPWQMHPGIFLLLFLIVLSILFSTYHYTFMWAITLHGEYKYFFFAEQSFINKLLHQIWKGLGLTGKWLLYISTNSKKKKKKLTL